MRATVTYRPTALPTGWRRGALVSLTLVFLILLSIGILLYRYQFMDRFTGSGGPLILPATHYSRIMHDLFDRHLVF